MLSYLCVAIGLLTSCDAYEFDLPEAGSIEDTSLPVASYSYVVNSRDFTLVQFTNTSDESIAYTWDFGTGILCKNVAAIPDKDGNDSIPATIECDANVSTTTQVNPLVRFVGAALDDVYDVSLTASDAIGNPNTISQAVLIELVPINPDVLNGDFDGANGQGENWNIANFTGGTTTPFENSSDGSWIEYDGSNKGSKTRGAKWGSYSSDPRSSDNRFAYQAIEVSPNVEYVFEYMYAIASGDGTNDRIVGEILEGHFTDGLDAVKASESSDKVLAQDIGTESIVGSNGSGKGDGAYTTVKTNFTSTTGLVSIWITSYHGSAAGGTSSNTWVDNVKVYPKP